MYTLLLDTIYANGRPSTRIWSGIGKKLTSFVRGLKRTPTCPVSVNAYWRDEHTHGPDMLRLGADENFNNDIICGVLRRTPMVDIVRVQDTVLLGADDPTVLDWGAREGRVLLITHDVRTMIDYTYARVIAGQAMPGVVVVRRAVSWAQAIDNIVLLVEGSRQDEWEGQVLYLPL